MAPLIDPRDADNCPGVLIRRGVRLPCGVKMIPIGVQGYDGEFRCLACHKLHCDMVLEESGDSAPNASEDRTRNMHDAPRGARLIDKNGRPLSGPEQDRAIARAAAREKKRAAVLKKYGTGSEQ